MMRDASHGDHVCASCGTAQASSEKREEMRSFSCCVLRVRRARATNKRSRAAREAQARRTTHRLKPN